MKTSAIIAIGIGLGALSPELEIAELRMGTTVQNIGKDYGNYVSFDGVFKVGGKNKKSC